MPKTPETTMERQDAGTSAWQPYQTMGQRGQRGESALRRNTRRRSVAKRWAWRDAYRRDDRGDDGFIKQPRIDVCGLAGFAKGSVGVMGDGSVHGLAYCGSVWTCPTCSSILRRARSADVERAVTENARRGGGAFLVTLTMAHAADDGLAELLDDLQAAFQAMAATRRFRDAMKDVGVFGRIRALEVTLGSSGWHPHYHFVLFADAPVGEAQAERLRGELYVLWSRFLGRLGRRASREHGVDVQACESAMAAARYLAKEVADPHGAKAGRGASKVPFELLDERNTRAEMLWAEYARAMRRRCWLRWSPRLRERLGMAREAGDAQVLAEADAGSGDTLALIDRAVWNEVRDDGALVEQVGAAIKAGDRDHAAALLGCSVEVCAVSNGADTLTLVPMFVRRSERRQGARTAGAAVGGGS